MLAGDQKDQANESLFIIFERERDIHQNEKLLRAFDNRVDFRLIKHEPLRHSCNHTCLGHKVSLINVNAAAALSAGFFGVYLGDCMSISIIS